MSIRWIAGILGDGDGIPSGDIVTLTETSFTLGFNDMSTPGSDQPGEAWSRTSGPTPTSSTGPGGGADPITRAVDPAQFYAFTEGTPASGGFGPQRTYTIETREFDASLAGLYELTFDLHMRFGSEGLIDDGTLFVEGWNGSAWSTISNTVTGSQQLTADTPWLASTVFGSYTSSGFSNSDFKFRFRFVTGAVSNNYDAAIDNVVVRGPEGDLPPPPDPNPVDLRAASFNTGLRRLHVSPTGAAPVDGSTPTQAFTNLQTALNALQAGDVLTIGAGNYFGTFNRSNLQGNTNNPVWIAEEVLGTVQILDVEQAAFNGTQGWSGPFGAGNDRYTANLGDTYMVVHDGDFLPKYSSVANLDAAAVNGVTKPVQGCAVSGSTLHIRLRAAVDPNGESVLIPSTASRNVVSFSNCNFVIWDGCTIEGGGEQAGVSFDTASNNIVVRHVTTKTSRFLCRVPSNTIVERCNYILADETDGGKAWMRECVSLNGGNRAAFFNIVKGDLADGGNAVYEGGIAVGAGGFQTGAVHTGCEFRENRHIGVFDGERFGEFRNSTTHDNVYDECGDDGIQFEDDRNSNHGNGNVAYFCRFRNPHGPVISHQNDGSATHTVIRCLVEITEPLIFRPEFLIKTIRTATGSTIHHLFNYYERFGSPAGAPWYPFATPQGGGQTTGGDAITNFRGNIVNLDGADVTNNSGGVPVSRADNVYVGSDVDVADYRGGADVDAGASEASLLLNADFTPQPGSPVLGVNVTVPGGVFDPLAGFAGSADDAGPFPDGFSPGADWPRPFTREDDIGVLPPRWTSPGA